MVETKSSQINRIIVIISIIFCVIDIFAFGIALASPLTGGTCEAWWIIVVNFALTLVIAILIIMGNPDW